MTRLGRKPRHDGFTLLELVVVTTIIAILAAIAIPSMRYVTSANRIATEINGLLGDMQLARSEAIKEGLPVTVCASSDGLNCIGSGGGNVWNTGWIVFLDSNGSKTVDAGEQVIKVQPAFRSSDTFVASATGFYAVTFNREGFGTSGVTSVVNIALHSTPVNNNWTRCLQVTSVGMMAVYKYNGGPLNPCT